jgi:hypothetical protein
MADEFRRGVHDEELYKFDQFAHATTVIQELHRLTHDGFVYHSSGKVTGMIDSNVDDFLVVVPAVTFPHFQRLQITAGRGDIDILVYEGATASDDGTPVSTFNVNRNSTNTPDTVLNSAPTISDVGTLIHTQWIQPTATGVGQSPAGITGETNGEEWVLKPSTKYLIRITNNSGATIAYRYEFLWYEIDYST